VPRRSGFGAGTRDFVGRANALRIVLADVEEPAPGERESLVLLAADIDDMTGEYLAAAADDLRAAGALDVVLLPTHMKKGRVGTRLEVLSRPEAATELERLILARTTTIGVRSSTVLRRALPREERVADVEGHRIRVKVVTLPDGTPRSKAEFDDVLAAARALGVPTEEVAARAVAGAAPTPPSEVHEY
jgi:hypothetical protein